MFVEAAGPNPVASLGAGDSFGELALMYNAPRAATITATAPSSLWAMDRVTFRSMLFEKANSKRETYKSFLSKVSLLAPLEPYEREKIADVLEEVAYADDEAIIKEGDAGDNLYIVEEGACVATKVIDGESVVVKEYAVGDFFVSRPNACMIQQQHACCSAESLRHSPLCPQNNHATICACRASWRC